MTNLKRNIARLFVVCSFALVMTGCANQIPEMTEQQNALVTEYAAGLLLKYHADYDGRLVDTSVVPELPPVIETPAEEGGSDDLEEQETGMPDSESSSNTTEEIEKPTLSIAQVLGADGFDIKYRTFEVCDKYPSTDSSPDELFFSMKAGAGNKLLVLKLDITNTSVQEVLFDTLSMTELDCKILINGNNSQRAYVSMLENDFMAISRNFSAGESYEAVIITEMPEAETQDITSVELQVKSAGRESVVKKSE